MPTSFSNRTLPSTSYGNRTVPTTTYDDRGDYLLKEDTFYLLLESGGRIVLRGGGVTPFTVRTKPSTSFTSRVIP